MATPKKNIKKINIIKKDVGFDKRQSYLDNISKNNGYLPKGINHEDMDSSFVDFIKDDLDVTIKGEKVPAILLTIQRWSEFSRTWQFSDKYKNIKIPFITIVRKPDPQKGTNQSGYFNIPGKPTYTYMKVPTWDGNRKGMDIYKIPQPVPVDLNFEVRVFCNRMRDLNKFNKEIIKLFSSEQYYIKVNEHPIPIILENIGDESVIDDFENKRYYVQLYEMKLMGYLLDEDDFEKVPAINRVIKMNEIDSSTRDSNKNKNIRKDK